METDDGVRRLIAFNLTGNFVAISLGSRLRVYSNQTGEEEHQEQRDGVIQILKFSPCGRYLLTGGDDKTVHVLRTDDWSTVLTKKTAKKASAGDFGGGGDWIVVADRFGDVYRFAVANGDGDAVDDTHPILGHFCSIITSAMVLDNNQELITCDRDGVVRSSVLPKNVGEGSFLVRHFFMGHTKFVSSATICTTCTQTLLVTGGGEGIVFFFDAASGKGLFQVDLRLDDRDGADIDPPVVLSLAACRCKPIVVALSEEAVFILCWNEVDQPIITTSFCLKDVEVPSYVAVDYADRIWIVGGPQMSNSREIQISTFLLQDDGAVNNASEMGNALSSKLEVRSVETQAERAAEIGQRGSLVRTLRRREYSKAEREERHRKRAYVRNAQHVAAVKNKRTHSSLE